MLAVLGASAAQQGRLWWAGHHRHHHRHADTPDDVHSPSRGFWWAHVGWVASGRHLATRDEVVRGLATYPELVFLDRHYEVVPATLAAAMLALGWWLGCSAPSLGTSAAQLFVWGFCVATVLSYHAVFTINSLAHGALITFGEGWHNDHHRYPASERQGFYWWEIDITHHLVALLAWLGLVWDVKGPPSSIYVEAESGPAS